VGSSPAGRGISSSVSKQVLELGIHHMFIGEVVAVRANEELVREDGSLDLSKVPLFSYVHGEYVELGERLGGYGCSM